MVTKKRGRTAVVYRGSEGFDRTESELRKQKAKNEARKAGVHMPFRFRVGVGDTTQFIVVDEEPSFFRYEHNLKNPATGRYDIFTGCTSEVDVCPVCESSGKESYYALYLTVIDLTPFETKDGVTHDFSRKLLVIKAGQQKKFHRVYAKAEAKGGSLRGALFETSRDGDRDSAIGNDIEFLEFLEEEELLEYERSWKDREGKKHTEKCHEPLDYDVLFPAQDSDELRALVGGEAPLGNRTKDRAALGRGKKDADDADDDDDEDGDWEQPAKKGRMNLKKAASRKVKEEEPEEDEEEDEDEAPAKARRPVGRGPSRPTATRKTSRKVVDEEEDEEEDEEDEEDEPPVRKSKAKVAPPTRKAARKPVVEEDDEEDAEEDEEDEPVPRRVSMRKKR